VAARPQTLVYLVGSREASLALDPWFVPVDAAIVGIVDQVKPLMFSVRVLGKRGGHREAPPRFMR